MAGEKGASVANFIDEVNQMLDRSKRSKRKKKIGEITEDHAAIIEPLMKSINPNFSIEGYELWIDGTGAEHIEKRHGRKGEQDQSMATAEAKSLIPFIADHPDSAEFIRDNEGNLELSERFFNSDNTRAPQIRLEKAIDGDAVYVSECVPDGVAKRVYITSAYIKKGSKGQLLNMDSDKPLQPTPEAPFDGNATTVSIHPPETIVNPNAQKFLENRSTGDGSLCEGNKKETPPTELTALSAP